MNYELSKKLKEGGFPQPEFETECDVWECCKHRYYFTEGERNDKPYYPTLSELIEACGECLSHIKRMPYEGGGWFAVSHCGHENHEPGGNNLEYQAPTPEEAVANLWLELNK